MADLIKTIERFKNAKVLVIGDIMVDHFIYGTVDRISPEAPVPVVNVKRETITPGGAANVANNVAKLGATAYIFGVTGNDNNGAILKQLMRNESNIISSGITEVKGFNTITKTRVIANNQQVVRVDWEDNKKINKELYIALVSSIRKAAKNADSAIISDYGKGLIQRQFFSEITKMLRNMGKFVALDPKVQNFGFYKNVSILTPNTNEASDGSRIKIKDETSLNKASQRIFTKVKPDYVLITRGAEGMSLFYPDGAQHHLKARAQKVYDVTGAGDTVISTITIAKSIGANILDACHLANVAAGVAVSQLGTYAVNAAEIVEALSKEKSNR
ncbi:MAG: D-glycero-beta-D-manno-heptose-7-phosphate kinase [Candidatus Marsarchaeota archaeon]|nr:D-glycero-beta-D-manno-heptose-7-phosphate kinase [Candidatus Marsarchaeota archaeon]